MEIIRHYLLPTSLESKLGYQNHGGSPRGVVASGHDCDMEVSEFELQSRYYVYFRSNTLQE